MKKRAISKILFLLIFWECCVVFITFYDSAVVGFKSEVQGEYQGFLHNLMVNMVDCLIGGLILACLEVLVLSKLFRRNAIGFSLLLKTMIYLLFILFFTSMSALYIYSKEFNLPIFSEAVFELYTSQFLQARVYSVIIYWGVACFLALFILQINEKFGQGVLADFLLGRYHQPKEDSRIFMFMDLKSSTTYAEKLGHIKYSQLIQDCFYDLTDVVLSHHAKIYQYVGDEVVLSWDLGQGLYRENCLRTFFAYEQLLKNKSDYYLKKYGMIPIFKAGLNLGPVTVAEVGEIKKELAYHGDVLNTASRIQEKCNQYDKKILLSEKVKKPLEKQEDYLFEFLGSVLLKGKVSPTNLYSVKLS